MLFTFRANAIQCAIVLLTATVCSAICITKDDLISGTTSFVAAKGDIYRVADSVDTQQAALFLRDLVAKILGSAPGELTGSDLAKGTASDQIKKMAAKTDIWQQYPADSSADLVATLTKVQTWANKGELVIATSTPADASKLPQVALVMPSADSPTGDPTKISVAYAGPPLTGGKNFVSASTPLSTVFPDVGSKTVVFYRYKL